MFKIQFIGNLNALQEFASVLVDAAKVSATPDAANFVVYDISSIDALYKVPRTFDKPTFFYITTDDKAVLDRIKEYSINGIFFAPLLKETIMAKLSNLTSQKAISRNPEEYETLRIKIMAKAENIPPLPALAQELIKLTRSDQTTITQLIENIKMDQGISTSVIKLVNSPFYGLRQEVSSIDRATALLGFNSVKNIALAISMDQYFQKPFSMYGVSGKEMWHHSYMVACISQEVASSLGYDKDVLYLAGLLHDIGKVILVDFLVKPVKYVEDEKSQLGFDHAEVGYSILKKWDVANDVTEAVKTHHEFDAATFGKIVFYANQLDLNKESAIDIIGEMGLVLGIKDLPRLQTKISGLLENNNEKFN